MSLSNALESFKKKQPILRSSSAALPKDISFGRQNLIAEQLFQIKGVQISKEWVVPRGQLAEEELSIKFREKTSLLGLYCTKKGCAGEVGVA